MDKRNLNSKEIVSGLNLCRAAIVKISMNDLYNTTA